MSNKQRCRLCGKPINLQKADNGKTYPLELTAVNFVPNLNGPARYITILTDGQIYVCRGAEPREGDKDVHIGWVDHRDKCRKRGSKK